jgi:hypothetical protein
MSLSSNDHHVSSEELPVHGKSGENLVLGLSVCVLDFPRVEMREDSQELNIVTGVGRGKGEKYFPA